MDHSPHGAKPDRKRPTEPVFFAPPEASDGHRDRQPRNRLPWVLAFLLIATLVVIAIAFGGKRTSGPFQAGDHAVPYIANVGFSDLHVSQGTNFAGSPVTYIDGTVTNRGNRTLIAAVAGADFPPADPTDGPLLETAPVLLIQTHEPAHIPVQVPVIETEPMDQAPLAPSATHRFRLIFAGTAVSNQVLSTLHVTSVKIQ